jgi:WD40 repeat protein
MAKIVRFLSVLTLLLVAACGTPEMSSTPQPNTAATAAPATATLPMPAAALPPRPTVAPELGALTPANLASLTPAATLGKGTLSGVAIAADGQQIAVVSSTGATLYDGQTLAEQYVIPTPLEAVGVAFSNRGAWLAIGLSDGSVIIVDSSDGSQRHMLRDPASYAGYHTFGVALAFSPDDTLLASSAGNTINLWQLADGAPRHTLSGHKNQVSALSFASDGATLLSIDPGMSGIEESDPLEARLWTVQSGALIRTFETTFYAAAQVVAPPGADTFVTTSYFEPGIIWRVNADALTQSEQIAEGASDVVFTADGSTLAVGREDGTMALHQSRDGALIKELTIAGSGYLALSGDAGKIVVGSTDEGVRLWSTASAELLGETGGFGSGINAIALSPDGSLLLVGTITGQLMLWDLASHTMRWSVAAHSLAVTQVAFAPDGKTVASGGDFMLDTDFPAEALRLWSADTGELLATLEGHTHTIEALTFSPDGITLASSSYDRTVILWQVEGGRFLKKLTQKQTFGQLEFTPDGQFLAGIVRFDTAGDDIWIWRMDTGEHTRGWPLADDHSLFSAMALSADGTTFVTSHDAALSVWSFADGAPGPTFAAADKVMRMALSPDGQLLAVGLYDGKIEIWNVATGTLLQTRQAHTSYTNAIAFTPGGATLISASDDGSIILWRAK